MSFFEHGYRAWHTLVVTGERGSGKTHYGADVVREAIEPERGAAHTRLALVGKDASAIALMVAAIQAQYDADSAPVFSYANRRLTWPDGAYAKTYTAEKPDQLRGPQHSFAWLDEPASWANLDAVWLNLQFSMRGPNQRIVLTGAPSDNPLLRGVEAHSGNMVVRL
jgi:phage terminase large subunit-like protein